MSATQPPDGPADPGGDPIDLARLAVEETRVHLLQHPSVSLDSEISRAILLVLVSIAESLDAIAKELRR